MDDTSDVIRKIVESTLELSEYTIVLDNLDLEANKIERYTIKNGKIIEKKTGSWEWDG
jgi:hypothetical protein